MLAKMEAKGQVTHESDGRVNIYSALIGRDQVSRSMVADLASRLFGGDVTELMSHLLDGCEVDQASLAELKKLIRNKEKELKDDQ